MEGYTLAEIADWTKTRLQGDPSHRITGVADLEGATEADLSFLGNARYERKMKNSKAGAVFVSSNTVLEEGKNYLISADPSRSFQEIVDRLMAPLNVPSAFTGVHPSATIHPSAKLGNNVSVCPNAVIDAEVEIGSDSEIGPGAYIGRGAKIGSKTAISANAVIHERTIIGDRCNIGSGTVIGLSGFGYTQDAKGRHHKLTHYGIVEIGHDVDIGSSCAIARGRFQKTTIGDGTKIDCLVEIGHNCQIGRHVLIVGQCALAGSVKIGDHVWMGGKVAIDGHLTIASGVMIRAYSGVIKSIPEPGAYGGLPAQKMRDENKLLVQLRNIDEYIQRIAKLEHALQELQREVAPGTSHTSP